MKISIEDKTSRRQFLRYALVGAASSLLPSWVYGQVMPAYESEYLMKRAMRFTNDMVAEMIATDSEDMRDKTLSSSVAVYTDILLQNQELGFVRSETGVYRRAERAFQGFESENNFNLAMPFFDAHESAQQYSISNPLIIGGPIFLALSEITQMWYALKIDEYLEMPTSNAIFPFSSDTPFNLLQNFLRSFSFPYVYMGKQFKGYQTATHIMYETKYPRESIGLLTFTVILLHNGQGEKIIIPPTSYDISWG